MKSLLALCLVVGLSVALVQAEKTGYSAPAKKDVAFWRKALQFLGIMDEEKEEEIAIPREEDPNDKAKPRRGPEDMMYPMDPFGYMHGFADYDEMMAGHLPGEYQAGEEANEEEEEEL